MGKVLLDDCIGAPMGHSIVGGLRMYRSTVTASVAVILRVYLCEYQRSLLPG